MRCVRTRGISDVLSYCNTFDACTFSILDPKEVAPIELCLPMAISCRSRRYRTMPIHRAGRPNLLAHFSEVDFLLGKLSRVG